MKNNQTLKIKRPSYVIAETSKAQKEILDTLTDLGYRWVDTRKANEYIPIEDNELFVAILLYPEQHALMMAPQFYLNTVKHKKTELKVSDFKSRVIL